MKKLLLLITFFISLFSLSAEKIKFVVGSQSSLVESGDELYIGYGSKVSDIIFENENPNIKKIVIEGAAFIHDYSFISKCKNLEILVLNDVKLDTLDFLESCKNLRILALDSVSFNQFTDFRKLESLEYLGMTNCNLSNFNILTEHASSLRYINLTHNKIVKFPVLNSKDKAIYFISESDVLKTKDKRFVFSNNLLQRLPMEYTCYLR